MVTKKTVSESTKPVSTWEQAEAGRQAEEVARSIQKHYGESAMPIIGSTFSQRGAAGSKAKQADFQRQQEFIPKAFETAGKIEEGQAAIADESVDFWRKYNLQADELAMKQNQQKRSADLFSEESRLGTEKKLKEIEFAAFQNDAKRQDALEKAYLDGHAEKELLKGSIAGAVKVSDIEAYWGMKINEIKNDLLDYEMMTKIEKEDFTAKMQRDAKNWGSIINGLVTVGKVGAENWDAISNQVEDWMAEDEMTRYAEDYENNPEYYDLMETSDSEFLGPEIPLGQE